MRRIFTLACILLFNTAYSQNLIPNPGFEQHSSCPDHINNTGTYFPCSDWFLFQNSADYYHSCNTNGQAGMQNAAGYQAPLEGDAYVGFYAYNGLTGGYTEYIGIDIPALEKDTAYVMTINVSRAGSNAYHYAVGGFGVYFYNSAPPAVPTSVIPQADYTNYGIISDSTNWVTLSDTFIANDTYTHLLIGDYKNPQQIDELFVGTNATVRNAYYYMDKVSLVKLSEVHLLNASSLRTHEASFYPNPMQSSATLKFANAKHSLLSLKVYDIVGHTVRDLANVTGTEVKIERGDLAEGAYYYELTNAEEVMVYRGKFVVGQ